MTLQSTRFDVRRYGRDVESHSHDHHQIVLPMQGVLEMEIGGTEGAVTDECAAVVPSGLLHGFAGSKDNAFLIVDLPTVVDDEGLDSGQLWSAAAEAPFVTFDPWLQGFCGFLAGQSAQAGFHGLQAEVAGRFVVEALAKGAGLQPAGFAGPLVRALRFIDRHHCAPITVASVAEAAGLSESRLHAVFKVQLGLSPKRCIARRRLRTAARLLETSGLPLAEIALQVGYGDQSAFTRAFRREMGRSPGDYRRCQKAQ